MERGPIVYLIAVGVVMGICAALFRPVEDTFLPQAVPADQLSAAVALNAARGSVAQLSGTAAGGFLFAVARFLPFLAYSVVCFLLVFLRVPPREVRPAPTRHLRRIIMVSLRWVSAHRHIRFTTLCAIVLNLFIRNVIVIVLAQGRGIRLGQIGTRRPLSVWPTGSW